MDEHTACLPLARDSRGAPKLQALPDILGALESADVQMRTAGALCLAQLVDGSVGEAACLLGEYMRDTGAHELLVLMLRREPASHVHMLRWLLHALGNACSDVVDANASLTREMLETLDVMPCVQAHLASSDLLTKLYAAAAMQNLCKDAALVESAVQSGAHALLEQCCEAGQPDPLRHFAAGALINMDAVLQEACATPKGQQAPPGGWRSRLSSSRRQPPSSGKSTTSVVSEAARGAMEWRKRKEATSRARVSARTWRKRQGADAAPFSRAAHARAIEPPAVPSATPANANGSASDGGPAGCCLAGVEADEGPSVDAAADQLRVITVQPPTEDALQTRIPLLDLSETRRHAQRRARGASDASDDDDSRSNSSWSSFFTARSCATSARSWGSAQIDGSDGGRGAESPHCNEV